MHSKFGHLSLSPILIILALLIPAEAQTAAPIAAADFASMQAHMVTPVAAPGSAAISVEPGFVSSSHGQTAPVLTEGGSISIGSGATAEVVTTTEVNCTLSPLSHCSAVATFRYAHPGASTPANSATHGLQEAIAYRLAHGGGEVDLTPGFGPGNSLLAVVKGGPTVFLVDQRGSGPGYWVWQNGAYRWSLPSAGGSLSASAPAITPDGIEATLYADQFSGPSVTAQIAAACAALSGANGIVIVPSTMDSGPLPTQPSGCTVEDQRGLAGSGAVQSSYELPWNGTALNAGNYVEGITATGTAGQTCDLSSFNHGSTATATVALTGVNTIAASTPLVVTSGGSGASAPPTSAVASNGSATCSGTAVVSTALTGPNQQYGFTFYANNLASDGQSANAILGEASSSAVGANVVGVRGVVFSPLSAGIYGQNFGAGSGCATGSAPCAGGAGVQGDAAANAPGAVGVVGVGCATGGAGGGTATAALPCYGVVGRAILNTTYGANIAGYFDADNGPALVANLSDTGGSIDPTVLEAESAEPTSTDIDIINTSSGGQRFDLRSTGAGDACNLAAGYFELYSKSTGYCPIAVSSAAPNDTLLIDGSGNVRIGGDSSTAINNSSYLVQNGGAPLTAGYIPKAVSASVVANSSLLDTGVALSTSEPFQAPSVQIGAGGILQSAASNTGGSCSMSAATTCTATLAVAYSTPICMATLQGTGSVIAGECQVSGTTVTVTAASSNSGRWGFLVFGDPH